MFFLGAQKSLRKIDHSCATEINIERRFLNRFALRVEVKSCISVRAVMYAHRDGTQIYGGAFGDLFRQPIMKRLVTGPFREVIRKCS